ncbi:amino acid adenylation domain-containing protein [Rhodomicrobium lacus]|uniref:amino acid adenylation domain-containing protein n=1 Tax=Rhodomicrobium lacus TaxID=2498452 RepID=UPI000F8D30F6|nr:amino acid adenylation domain-containing protein [Rhodomicrobium lacus]
MQNSKTKVVITMSEEESVLVRPLTKLQQAYLLGRERHLPLGGVAMQEFREYRGRIDLDRLPERLMQLVRRHECLRTRIDSVKLVQQVLPDAAINYEEVDLRSCARSEAFDRIDELRSDFAHELFDLAAPPWRVTAFRLSEPDDGDPCRDSGVVFVRFDALILDGQSIATLMIELFGAEAFHLEGTKSPAIASSSPEKAARAKDGNYWREKLAHITDPAQLPWKKPLETIASSRYDRATLIIDRDSFAKLSSIGARHVLFKNTVIMAVILEVLSKWQKEGALCVGVPVAPPASRSLSNESSFIAISWDRRDGSILDRTRMLQTDIHEGLAHLSFSGVDIARLLVNAHRQSPALPVVVTNGLSWPTLPAQTLVRQHAGLTQTPQVAMDIRLTLDPAKNLVIDIDHTREAIDREIVLDLLKALERAIKAICSAGALTFEHSDVVDLQHYRHNTARQELICSNYLQRIADNLFSLLTSKTAMVCGERRLSYRDLGLDVAKAMASLRAQTIGRGSVVAICLPRSPEHMAVTLASAFTGAIWVPIDAASPPDRLHYLLENCRPDIVIASSLIAGFKTLSVEEMMAQEAPRDPYALAEPLTALSSSEEAGYYLYTSGTTGKPKCVVLSNKATSNVIERTIDAWSVTERDVFMSVTPLHHDMSVFDIFGCLTAGATLVYPEAAKEKDAIDWNRLIAKHGVTIWCSVPAILEMLLACRRSDELKSLRLVAQGGDYIKPSVVDELRQMNATLRLISLGGPTETTIWSIWHEIGSDDIGQIPYGRPLPGNSYFIIDDMGNHCPAGVTGRIHTAGVNVALGYIENGGLHQTDFVTVADENGLQVRAFRTGDCGRYRKDGTILFSHRVNGYIKIRGVRVSLPDIESELVEHRSVQRALVVDYGSEHRGEAAIGALYVARSGADVTAAELRAFARRRLPESHVPTVFTQVNDLPLSPNGKPDRRRARELFVSERDRERKTGSASTLSTTSDRERRVLAIYLEVLGASADGPDSGTQFMSLGLLPLHLHAVSRRMREEFGVELLPKQLLKCRNARQVASLLLPQPEKILPDCNTWSAAGKV